MSDLLTLIILIVWLGGTIVRMFRQTRFFQIEEYMNLRYLRWYLNDRQRWTQSRTTIAVSAGMLFGIMTDSIPGALAIMPYVAAIVGAAIAVYPPGEGEIKRKFNRTQRAVRLLVTMSLVALVLHAITYSLILAFAGESDRTRAILAALGSWAIFMLAPLWIVLANLINYPIESFMRRRFLKQAENVLAQVRPRIIGITGSYGKTTTKNYLRDILNGRYRTYATPKSYNTLMGISLAINNDLANDFSVEYFISEMGAYIEGEIERICKLTPPDISIVVDVGPQHLERFGTLENIATAKYEIIKNLPPTGLGVFNWDNPYVRAMYERSYPQNRIAVSRHANQQEIIEGGPRFIASDITETLQGLRFTITDMQTGDSAPFEVSLAGEHNITNLLLATAVAVHEGMPLRDVAMRARMLQPAESRLVRQSTANGITIINDSYSTNPVGSISALKVLSMYQTGKRLLITPGMVELGELHDQENEKLGVAATHYATDIILVGRKQTEPIKRGILKSGFPEERLLIVDTLSEAVQWYQTHLEAGDTVLFLNDLPDTY
jgi:UDP-N-acetylmuramoyl-tripeptide--D-alanyl-D-alanine ligase